MIHHVFANRSNIGDWLSARAIQALLAPEPFVEHLCDEPFVPRTLERLARLTDRDLIVIGGGGLFMDYFVPFWEGFREISKRVPFCIWGVGYCHMKRQDSRPPTALIEDIVRNSSLCVIRDDITRRYLANCDIPPPVPCPTISIVESRPPGHGLLHVDAFDNVGESNFETMEAVGKAFATKTNRPFHSINNLIPAGNGKALETAVGRYEQADLILTGRLHGCIIGLAMGRKVLAVSGDHKVESFMQAAGLGDWVLDLAEMDQLEQRLGELTAQPKPEAFVADARLSHRRVAEQIRQLLVGKGGVP